MSHAFYIWNPKVKHGFYAIYSCCFILFAVKSASTLAYSVSWSGKRIEIPSEYEVCISYKWDNWPFSMLWTQVRLYEFKSKYMSSVDSKAHYYSLCLKWIIFSISQGWRLRRTLHVTMCVVVRYAFCGCGCGTGEEINMCVHVSGCVHTFLNVSESLRDHGEAHFWV